MANRIIGTYWKGNSGRYHERKTPKNYSVHDVNFVAQIAKAVDAWEPPYAQYAIQNEVDKIEIIHHRGDAAGHEITVKAPQSVWDRAKLVKYDLYIFDLDGTIAKKYTTDLLPGVEEWFATIHAATALATNQGGVGLRYWMEKDGFGNPDGLPTIKIVEDRLDEIKKKLGREDILGIASFAYQSKKSGEWGPTPEQTDRWNYLRWHPSWRKPQKGMLAYAQAHYQLFNAVMIGDSVEDEKAANAEDIDFILADEFFSIVRKDKFFKKE